ncbi:hypothetical protein Cgig2_024674 [Carnegiea gigantea]|uniref:Response regulatory domain-containing protein n=1 Tax=Carnegiea gigantea TaxID=171969 RepID=A0A9Q1QFG2_9CARY|nr:hypothetical protein Cgig2_024674 [Carnegiea gigantea]
MVMNAGFSSPRRIDAFPVGLRVLVVDDDPTWLKILEKMLKKCSYEVTTCALAWDALKLLRERKDSFDIVISDVNMPDMDGFKLLEHIGLEMDLPVIMMSVDGETSRVMKGVQHGACDYLLKPIRMKELKNIWQHVVRKWKHEVADIECFEGRNGPDHSNDGHYGGDQTLLKKRKDVDNKHDEKDSSDPSSTKKARVVWTVELHQKFVNAVNQIGIDSDKVGPKRILDLMDVPWLSRENVASHLQKYRLYLSRLRRGDKPESSFGGMKNPDHSPKESSGRSGLQQHTFGQQNDVNSNYGYPGNQLPVQSMDAKPLAVNMKSSDLLPLTEQQRPVDREDSVPGNVGSPQVELNHTFGSIETAKNYASFESPVAARYPWTAEIPEMQFETEFKSQPNLEDSFNHPTGHVVQQHVQSDLLESAPHINRRPSISKCNNSGGLTDIKPLNVKQCGNDIGQLLSSPEQVFEAFHLYPEAFGCFFDMPLDMNQYSSANDNGLKEQSPLERLIQSFPLHSQSRISTSPGSEPNFNVTVEMKNQSCSQGNIIGLESEQRNQVLGCKSPLELLDTDLIFHRLQGSDGPSKEVGLDLVGLSDSNFPYHTNEVPLPTYVPRSEIDYEFPFDWLEHPFADQRLLFSDLAISFILQDEIYN